ncbi:MAG TPA: GlsB/YeaQ/YmgE family stress response membrane protein [Paracoccaceae bacterium]|nr:GlsB/YeaQ/YmgE family stress response membrane protein [Paracoccaceae bacterium]
MPIIALIVIGAAAGFIATRLMKVDTDLITTIVIGILGALIAGTVLRILLALTGWAAGFVGAVLGAMALVWLWNAVTKGRR